MSGVGVCRSSMRSPPSGAGVCGVGGLVGSRDLHTTPARQQQAKVSFASAAVGDDDHASPRSCVVDIFRRQYHDPYYAHDDDDDAMMMGIDDDEMEDEETPAEVAMLLASVADIAKKEIFGLDPPVVQALAEAFPAFPAFPDLAAQDQDPARRSSPPSFDEEADYGAHLEEAEEESRQSEEDGMGGGLDRLLIPPTGPPSLMMHFDHRKTRDRAVSMDFPHHHRESDGELSSARRPPTPPHEDEAIPTLLRWRNLSYVFDSHNSGIGRPRAVSLAEAAIENRAVAVAPPPPSDCSATPNEEVGARTTTTNDADKSPLKLILRKKFSWKNYPNLEEFLVANREEYLRHSTLNYTMQQKKYNNCLTLRMIKLAAEHGYLFDDAEFSFVTVRDRIRCYFKSYVQSMKKRGMVIGYAARKAGLVTEEELEESAHTSGKIYVPKNRSLN